MSLGEDSRRARTRETPAIIAALSNAGLRLLRSSGVTNIAAAPRRKSVRSCEVGDELRPFMTFE